MKFHEILETLVAAKLLFKFSYLTLNIGYEQLFEDRKISYVSSHQYATVDEFYECFCSLLYTIINVMVSLRNQSSFTASFALCQDVRNTPAASWNLFNYYLTLAWIVAGSPTPRTHYGIPRTFNASLLPIGGRVWRVCVHEYRPV